MFFLFLKICLVYNYHNNYKKHNYNIPVTISNTKLTNEHVTLLAGILSKLTRYPHLINGLTVDEVVNLSTFCRQLNYVYKPITRNTCSQMYHRFQEFGSKYNLMQFVNSESP